nr:EOG090X08PA [Cyclestheria hislopi]
MPASRTNWLLISLVVICISYLTHAAINPVDVEDNEFAEFEDFDTEKDELQDNEKTINTQSLPPEDKPSEDDEGNDDDEATVETEESDFEHVDEEEFEGFDDDQPRSDSKSNEGPKITFARLPAHLRSNWESYYLELLILAGLVVYFINFFIGRSKNQKIAETWFATYKKLLEENFALVGDDGKLENSQPSLIKESENTYLLWCSGRTCCEGMLIELKLQKRQDLVSIISGILRPQFDQIHVKVFMNHEDMDSYVLCLATKKTAAKLAKEMADLSVFCPEKKSVDKYNLPSHYVLLSEIGEATSSLLDSRLCGFITKVPNVVDVIHISDQYSGPKQPEDTTPSKMPDTKKMLIFTFNLCIGKGKGIGEAIESLRPAFFLVFHCMDRVKRFRLGKEAKLKAEKNRQKVEEAFLKSTHAARAEAAAARREEKRRQEKEKILQDDDPEKQRKWEEKEAKRLAKKRMPKMKAIKV